MGKKGDLSNFEHGMVVGARVFHNLLSYWDFHMDLLGGAKTWLDDTPLLDDTLRPARPLTIEHIRISRLIISSQASFSQQLFQFCKGEKVKAARQGQNSS